LRIVASYGLIEKPKDAEEAGEVSQGVAPKIDCLRGLTAPWPPTLSSGFVRFSRLLAVPVPASAECRIENR
jgi:hypothetical protein